MTKIKVNQLSCEYQINPLGIGARAPRLSWKLQTDGYGARQKACQIQVSHDLGFQNLLWDSGEVKTSQSHLYEYGGPPMQSRQRCYWRVRIRDNRDQESGWSETAWWEAGLLELTDWQAAWINHPAPADPDQPCPLLRRQFSGSGPVKKARLYLTARGLYQAYINGRPVTSSLFDPGWTVYPQRLQVQTYDVTSLMQTGDQVIGIMLGEGWYKGTIGFSHQSAFYGDQIAAFGQLEWEYEDGSREIIATDEKWLSTEGPVRFSSLYNGEYYDQEKEMPNWHLPGPELENSGWQPVRKLEFDNSNLLPQESQPVRVIESIKPVACLKTPAGDTVIDMGQNMVGWLSIQPDGPVGTEISLQHAEVLDRDGEFYTKNLRKARQQVTYRLDGRGKRWLRPHFSWQGFRYVKITGWPEPLELDDIQGQVLHTDMPRTGTFACSDPLVNQLQHNIVWGQKGNFLDIPTDCPQRDERLGWTGDAQMFIRTACFNYQVAPFFTKWLHDLQAEQSAELGVPFVVPHVLDNTAFNKPYSSAAWGDAATICPWTIYLCYGDRRLLSEQYGSMRDWVDYICRQGESPWLWNTGFHFGDWLALDARENSYVGATAKDLIATAFFALSTSLVARAAHVLGYHDDARTYQENYQKIAAAFRREFITPSGRLAVPTQTAHVLVLMFELAQPEHRQRLAADLAELIRENGEQLATGFVGTPYLCHVLSQHGYHDLACRLLLRREYPSWLYPITQGATTIWEHWDSIKPDGSFWSDDMNSFNHYAYGAIGDWLYRVVCGIDTDPQQPGYRHSLIRPRPIPDMQHARAGLETAYGLLESGWQQEKGGGRYLYEIKIPENTTASVMIRLANPADPAGMAVNGRLLAGECGPGSADPIPGLLDWTLVESRLRLELGSGTYLIRA